MQFNALYLNDSIIHSEAVSVCSSGASRGAAQFGSEPSSVVKLIKCFVSGCALVLPEQILTICILTGK